MLNLPAVRAGAHEGEMATGMPITPARAMAQPKAAARQALQMAPSGTFSTIRSLPDTGQVPAPAVRPYLLSQHDRTTMITLMYSEDALLGTVKC